MARQKRLAAAGQVHLVTLPAADGRPLCLDDEDRRKFVAALRDAAVHCRCAVHAHALLDAEALLLVTPERSDALSRLLQELGRRYVAGFNRRHGRGGPLWAGRFRAAILQPGPRVLEAMLYVDLLPVRAGIAAQAGDYAWSSARHHLGQARDPAVSDNSAYWQLGNTPFDREQAYRRWLDEGLAPARVAELDDSSRKGWALGDAGFLVAMAELTGRPVRPRPRGRPAKPSAA